MPVAYRDDLDDVLRRAAELERANAQLRTRYAELEQQLAPPSPPTISESEADRARLASVDQREQARSLVRTFTFIGTEPRFRLAAGVESGDSSQAEANVFALALCASAVTCLAGGLPVLGIVVVLEGVAFATTVGLGVRRWLLGRKR